MSLFTTAEGIHQRAIALQTTEADFDTVISWPEEDLSVLFGATDSIRRHFFKNTVDPCSLLNVKSGNCSEDCAFCSQSSSNHASVNITELVSADAIKAAQAEAQKNNVSFCVVSSGRKLSGDEIKKVANVVRDCNGPVHASLGILTEEEFAQLASAGVVCYNHNIETSERFYGEIVSTHKWSDRVDTVRAAKKAGLSVCCGGIFGMGETWADRKDMCRVLRELDVDTVPVNFFNPIEGTRLAKPAEKPMDFLRIVALFRVALPNKIIKVCGGRELHLGDLAPLMFLAGANGYITGNYLTTSGAPVSQDNTMIASLGLVKDPH